MRNLFWTTSLFALATGVMIGQPAASQEAQTETLGEGEIVTLERWTYDPLYTSGWSVEQLLDEGVVIGEGGEEIGSVENVIIGADAEMLAIIAQVGGFLDIGDTHVSVPWDEAERAGWRLTIPVNEENVDDFSVFAESGFFYEEMTEGVVAVDDDLETASGIFKATDLIGDYAYLSGGERYGYVNDLLILDGKVSAVVVDAAGFGTPGYYAYPYSPNYPRDDGVNHWRYTMPYAVDDVTTIETFDYGMLKDTTGMSGENPDDS